MNDTDKLWWLPVGELASAAETSSSISGSFSWANNLIQ